VVVFVDEMGPALGFAARQVGGLLGRDYRCGDSQVEDAADTASAPRDLTIVLAHGDFVAEELRRLGEGERDQRLIL
jgi:hypothetical protein